ncbi:hypothetical protein [Bradyrhizobium sp. SZCCHNR1039]|uniref:hypothetical protein n=1 Tax=Bradyrhizobium sp. SZCCHNR1039 TaxID=3057350 RepID=UPI002915F7DE|nr:hypothetical protein [Bradyrhizobium sp. SZCCHNR1039]
MLIDVAAARRIAEEAAQQKLERFLAEPDQPLLRDEFLEGANCWFFFRDPAIVVPPQYALGAECAYAVSKRGAVRTIADFFSDKEKLDSYLKTMSDYFLTHDE